MLQTRHGGCHHISPSFLGGALRLLLGSKTATLKQVGLERLQSPGELAYFVSLANRRNRHCGISRGHLKHGSGNGAEGRVIKPMTITAAREPRSQQHP